MRRQLSTFRMEFSANQAQIRNTMKSVQNDVQSMHQQSNKTRCELTNQISSDTVAIAAVQTLIAKVETVGQSVAVYHWVP